MEQALSRRSFLKISTLALTSLAFQPARALLPPDDLEEPFGIGRVTTKAIRIYAEPNHKSDPVRWARRDDLLDIIAEVQSSFGPASNPRWYRVVGGYAHSAYLQRVERATLNAPLHALTEERQLAEVTVPFVRSLRFTKSAGWTPLYRLYFTSVHWITHLEEGPDGEPWYGITDDRLRVVHFVPASHLRPIPAEELTPLSPEVPAQEKRIELSIARQTVTAYESGQIVFQTSVSTGRPSYGPSPNGIPTDTPTGRFTISVKTPSRHMGDGQLTSDIEAYELPGVPWVSFFHHTGVGFHGTYWHDNFGARMSAGCVNMRNEEAKWLYRWTTPEVPTTDWYKTGRGTPVQVI